MKVIEIDPLNDPRWMQLVQDRPSDIFHSPGWMRVLKETYDFPVHAYVLINNAEQPLAGFPFSRIIDDQGERIISLPFSDYCDPIAESAEHWEILSRWLEQTGCPVIMRCLHNELPMQDARFVENKKAKWHGVDLQEDVDTLWNKLPPLARNRIRKAQGNGMQLHIAESEADMRAFFELHLGLRKYKYHMLAQPYRFFERIWSILLEPKNGALMLAKQDDTVIGGTMYLEWKDTLYYKFNTSNPDYLKNAPNDYLVWQGIQYAKSQGLKRLDFGLSDWDQEGLLRFKRKYATEEKKIAFLRHTPVGEGSHNGSPFRQLLPHLTDLFTDENVPDEVTEKAGDLLYKFFT